jgi:phosphoribosylaminoimidazole-succinocarboxamide synthase
MRLNGGGHGVRRQLGDPFHLSRDRPAFNVYIPPAGLLATNCARGARRGRAHCLPMRLYVCSALPRARTRPGSFRAAPAQARETQHMARRRQLYEGKAKIIFEGPEPGTVVQYFKDDATAFNNQKKGTITGKGVLNNRISEYLMTRLGQIGVPTHFIRRLNMREQLVRQAEIIPLEVIVRNLAAGSFAQRFKMEEGTPLPRSIIEFCYKNDDLGDPMVAEEHITAFGWASPPEIDDIVQQTIRINDFLSGLFLGIGIKLVDFKIEFGRVWDNDVMRIILADEISPDSCRLWDADTNEKMDKDRFRRDMGDVEEAYQEVARRLGVMPENPSDFKGPKLVH